MKLRSRKIEKLEDKIKWKEELLNDSDILLKAIIEQSGICISIADPAGDYIFVNPAFCEITGYTKAELLTMNVLDLTPPELELKLFLKVLKNQSGQREKELVKKGGSRFFAEIVGYPIKPKNQLFVLEIIRDITKQKRAEEALRASEEKYRLLTEYSTDVIYKVNLINEQYSYVSPSAENIFGYTIDEILDLKVSDVLTPESYAQQQEELESDIKQGKDKTKILEMEVLHKDGRVIPVEINARILFDKHGVPKEILGIARDIKRRKKAELALRKSEKRFKFLAENMGDIVWTIDVNFNTTYVSPSIKKVLGYTPEERKKQKLKEMVTAESFDRIMRTFVNELGRERHSDIDKNRSITIEVEYYHRNGKIIWLENQIKAIRNQAGDIIGMYGVSRDITERKRVEQDLLEEKKKLEEAITEVRKLSGLLPICAHCKKIRDDRGYWNQIESYISDHSEAEFSHSICPECAKKLYPDLDF